MISMCSFLEQANPTHLKEISLHISTRRDPNCALELDKSSCMDKILDLDRFNLSIEPDPNVKDWDAMAVAKAIFPHVEARGILHLVTPSKAELP